MHKQIYTRKLSYTERLFIAADEICSPMLNQFFFEGTGTLDKQKWEEAVKLASEANPGSRLMLKGFLGRSRWIDSGETPPVIEVDGSRWDARGPSGAPFLESTLSPWHPPTCQVLLIHGDIPKVAFRTHHAVMDGRGTLTWAEDIFRALRGEKLIGSSSSITDMELARIHQKKYRTPFPRDSIAPTGDASGNAKGVIWKRMIIPGKIGNVTGQVAVLAAREAWKHENGPVRFAVPVDLRQHEKNLRSTANLSIALYIEVQKNSTPESVSLDIKKQIEEKRSCMIDRSDPLISYLPIRFLSWKGRSIIKYNSASGRYGTSGILSNMGRIPFNTFSGGGFTSTMFWGIPPSLENVPFFIGMTARDVELELILSLPRVLAGENRLDTILNNIADGLVRA